VLEIDGHNMEAIVDAAETAKAVYEKPTIIIAHTIPGKGIPEIEFDYTWHGKTPKKEEAKKFLASIRSMSGTVANTDCE
jgi:transketolase